MVERYDPALLGILQHEGKLEKFLDVIMGFLYNRTDFFLHFNSKEDKLGFPPGAALDMVCRAFDKYDNMARIRESKIERPSNQSIIERLVKENEVPVAKEEIVTSCGASSIETENKSAGGVQAEKGKDQPPMTSTASHQKTVQNHAESYNGAVRENYSWTQTITDCDILAKVPKNVKKGKDVKVDMKKKHLSISYRDESGEFVTSMAGELSWEINLEESMWTLAPGEHVHVNVEKVQERWWENVLQNEQKINLQEIHPERPLGDLDESTQAKVQEMMYNERQKAMGLPTSDQQKKENMLRDAWDVEGSPFKGTPFDPSRVDFTTGTGSLP